MKLHVFGVDFDRKNEKWIFERYFFLYFLDIIISSPKFASIKVSCAGRACMCLSEKNYNADYYSFLCPDDLFMVR